MLASYVWTGMYSQSCCQLLLDSVLFGPMRLLPPIKPDAVGYLDMKDVHKNTLFWVMGFCSVCHCRQCGSHFDIYPPKIFFTWMKRRNEQQWRNILINLQTVLVSEQKQQGSKQGQGLCCNSASFQMYLSPIRHIYSINPEGYLLWIHPFTTVDW